MLELDDESKIIKKQLVIKETCSWLPPGLDGRTVGDMAFFQFSNMAAVRHLGFLKVKNFNC